MSRQVTRVRSEHRSVEGEHGSGTDEATVDGEAQGQSEGSRDGESPPGPASRTTAASEGGPETPRLRIDGDPTEAEAAAIAAAVSAAASGDGGEGSPEEPEAEAKAEDADPSVDPWRQGGRYEMTTGRQSRPIVAGGAGGWTWAARADRCR